MNQKQTINILIIQLFRLLWLGFTTRILIRDNLAIGQIILNSAYFSISVVRGNGRVDSYWFINCGHYADLCVCIAKEKIYKLLNIYIYIFNM